MSVLAATTMSSRGVALLRTFRAAFEALTEHGKAHPHEQTMIAEACAAHLRSAWPMAALAAPAPLETGPVMRVLLAGPIHVKIGDGAFYEVNRREDGLVSLYLHDALEHDADVALTPVQADALCQDIANAKAGR